MDGTGDDGGATRHLWAPVLSPFLSPSLHRGEGEEAKKKHELKVTWHVHPVHTLPPFAAVAHPDEAAALFGRSSHGSTVLSEVTAAQSSTGERALLEVCNLDVLYMGGSESCEVGVVRERQRQPQDIERGDIDNCRDDDDTYAFEGNGRGLGAASREVEASDVLLRQVTFTLMTGTRLLITGPSGCGKTTLLRCLAGLAGENSSGGAFGDTIRYHVPAQHVRFIPQRSYCFRGSLLSNMLYPTTVQPELLTPSEITRVVEALSAVDLSHLLAPYSASSEEGAGAVRRDGDDGVPSDEETRRKNRWELEGLIRDIDWPDRLSPGEQQRLEAARVVLVRPQLCFLDEATSSLDEMAETRVYSALLEACAAVVSVAHRRSVRRFHTAMLTIDAHGHCSYNPHQCEPEP